MCCLLEYFPASGFNMAGAVHFLAISGQLVIHPSARATLIAQGAMFMKAVPGIEGEPAGKIKLRLGIEALCGNVNCRHRYKG